MGVVLFPKEYSDYNDSPFPTKYAIGIRLFLMNISSEIISSQICNFDEILDKIIFKTVIFDWIKIFR